MWSGALRRGNNCSGVESLREDAENSNNVTSIFFSTVDLLPKDIRFERGGAKLASCPGRHLSSLRPWEWWVLQQIIILAYSVASHWWVSILDRICYMKTWNSILKSFTQPKLMTSPDICFLFLWNNVYESLGTNYCIPKRWLMGPLQLSLRHRLKPLVTPLNTGLQQWCNWRGCKNANLPSCQAKCKTRPSFSLYLDIQYSFDFQKVFVFCVYLFFGLFSCDFGL